MKPGDSIAHTLKLRVKYGELDPGHYELKASYRVTRGSVLEKEFGMTLFSLEQKVLYLEIK